MPKTPRMDDEQRMSAEKALIRSAVATLAKLCEGDEKEIVERLEGYLWDEEEASGIKDGIGGPGPSPGHDAEYQVEKAKVDTIMVKFSDGADKSKDVSVTEWINGEGFDISVDTDRVLPLSYAEAGALKFALSQLDL